MRRREKRRGPAPEPSGVEFVYGVHSVEEALAARRRRLRALYLRKGPRRPALERIASSAEAAGVSITELEPEELARLGGAQGRSQGVVLEAGPLPELTLERLCAGPPTRRPWLVALDGIEDPQNVGAIARVAEACGARGLVLTERRAPPLSPTVSRCSAGALELLPVARVKNLGRALAELKERGFWVFGATPSGQVDVFELSDRQLQGNLVLVLGAEGRGMRPGIQAALDHAIRIPMLGRVGSLNVSAAAAVILFEWMRRTRGEGRV